MGRDAFPFMSIFLLKKKAYSKKAAPNNSMLCATDAGLFLVTFMMNSQTPVKSWQRYVLTLTLHTPETESEVQGAN